MDTENQKKRNSMAKTHLSGYKSPKHFSEIAIPSESTRLDSENVQMPAESKPELDFKETSPNTNRSILGDIKKESQNAVAISEDEFNIPIEENSDIKNVSLSKTKKNAKSDSNTKINVRASQQFLHKKLWKRQFKIRHQKCNQKQTQINKADMENIQNIKNQIKHHNNKQQHTHKNSKPIFNKKSLHCSAPFAIRSKFFLPDKRPRKEVIIPPTKFLLGGNISDPLNLNSLQDEALNATPTPTPKQSPITTPPKVEVIIPPNIHDPLHLLDPVDSIEYEKLLVSPMKRKSKSKHRNRKKKPKKRKRVGNSSCTELPVSSANGSPIFPGTGMAITSLSASKLNSKDSVSSANDNVTNAIDGRIEPEVSRDICRNTTTTFSYSDGISYQQNLKFSGFDSMPGVELDPNTFTQQYSAGTLENVHQKDPDGSGSAQKGSQDSAQKSISNALVARRNVDREKAARDLRLDLASAVELQQQNQQHFATSSVVGRKRKISEGLNSAKNKFRRMDSMDKIVSPVIPQPGAWKRPPRTVPSGARKMSRVRSTSVSETDLISPTEETKIIESESIRGNTPDVETLVKLDENKTKESNKDSEMKPKFRPEGIKYQYGNYDRYPGYRYLNEFMDVRLQVFLRNNILFKGKDVLDIGCNIGHITIAVAKDLAPKSILGIDIDQKLINKARKNLSMYVKIPDHGADFQKDKATGGNSSRNTKSIKEINTVDTKTNKIQNNRKNLNKVKGVEDKPKFFPISFPMCLGRMPRSPCVDGGKDDTSNSHTSPVSGGSPLRYEFPKNINFRTQNYVLLDEALLSNDTQQYDLILCLSVTKWIHLNFGDNGLKLAFKRMFNQLRPGGKLILEAQNWASYKKKKNLTETIYNNYKNIEFFPNKFHEYLLSNEVGFSHSYTLGVPRHLSKGFCRPIQLYAKGDFTPSHIRWSDAYYPQTPYEAYRGIYASMPHPPHHVWNETPRGSSSSYSCRQTPMHQPTSQYYNPLETDSYLPSYDTEVLNRHYVFASPLYQTVWSPPASMRNSSSHTPVFGSVRDCDLEDGVSTSRHVYPPTEEYFSPQVSSGAFNSIREIDSEECTQYEQSQHVYASCESSSSPNEENSVDMSRNQETSERNYLETNTVEDSGGGIQVESGS